MDTHTHTSAKEKQKFMSKRNLNKNIHRGIIIQLAKENNSKFTTD